MNITVPAVNQKDLMTGIMLLVLSALVMGAIFPLTAALAGMQDADGILTSLISTEKLTWYFWGQDRLLNFIPALASPFTDVETNLKFQIFLRCFFSYLSPLGILIFFNRSPRFLLIAVALANVILLTCLSQFGQFNLYAQHNTFSTSLVLFAVAYSLTYTAWPKAIIALLMLGLCCLAYATNYALLTYSIPFISLLVILRSSDRKRYIYFIVVNIIAILIARYHSMSMGQAPTNYGIDVSFEGLIASLKIIVQHLNLAYFLFFVGVAIICHVRTPDKRWLDLGAATGTALAIIILLSNMVWLKMNNYNLRYFLTSEIIIGSILSYVITRAWLTTTFRYRSVAGLCVAALTYCLFVPLGGFRSDYKEVVQPPQRDDALAVAHAAIDQKARVIIGAFWDAWPAVYDTKKLQASLPDASQVSVYGAADRGDVLSDEFRSVTAGQGEQIALCFYNTADSCIKKISDGFQTPLDRVILKNSAPLEIGSKQMLKIVFEIK
jgi:hypothetical protein